MKEETFDELVHFRIFHHLCRFQTLDQKEYIKIVERCADEKYPKKKRRIRL